MVATRWLVFVISLFCFLSEATGNDDDDHDETKWVCEGLMYGNERTVMGISLYKDRMLIVTSDLWIFDFPYINFNIDARTLNITGKPMKLKDKWPALAKEGFLKPGGDYTAGAIRDINEETWYIFSGSGSDCLAYNLDNINASLVKFPCMPDLVRPDPQRKIGFISCELFFGFGFCSVMASTDSSPIEFMQVELSGDTINSNTRVLSSSVYKSFCYASDSNDEIMYSDNCQQQKATDFGDIYTGLYFNSTFYLFDKDQVFPVYFSYYRKVPAVRVKLSDFFLCPNVHSSRGTIIIYVIVFITIIIICIIGYVCYRFISKRRAAEKSMKTNKVKSNLSHHGSLVAASHSSLAQRISSGERLSQRSLSRHSLSKSGRIKSTHSNAASPSKLAVNSSTTIKSSRSKRSLSKLRRTASPSKLAVNSSTTIKSSRSKRSLNKLRRTASPSKLAVNSSAARKIAHRTQSKRSPTMSKTRRLTLSKGVRSKSPNRLRSTSKSPKTRRSSSRGKLACNSRKRSSSAKLAKAGIKRSLSSKGKVIHLIRNGGK